MALHDMNLDPPLMRAPGTFNGVRNLPLTCLRTPVSFRHLISEVVPFQLSTSDVSTPGQTIQS